MADDEIILSELDDEELVLQMHDDLYDDLKEEIEDHIARQVHFARIVGKWRGELER